MEPFHKKDITDGAITENLPFPARFYKKILNLFRMPFFLTGVGLLGKGIYDVFDYVKTGNNDSLNSAFFDLSIGYSFLGLSASIYVKDSDTKLLDKKSLLEEVSDWTKDKMNSLVPQPIPEPTSFSENNLLPSK